jgi:hypothetical protein
MNEIQTWEPSSPGMIKCVSGGGYVKKEDYDTHLAEAEQKYKDIDSAAAIEVFRLKKELAEANEALAHGIECIHDATAKVICLEAERDDLRKALNTLNGSLTKEKKCFT